MTVCGTGGWNGPKPGDPDNTVFLTATPTLGGINVRWTYPGTNPHAVAYTEVYRSTSNVWATAQQLAIVSGNFLFDQITQSEAQYFYYWIIIVSVNGTRAERIGPASALYGPTVASMIELLSGQIDRSVLAFALSQEIDQIQLNKLNITQEMLDRDAADDSLAVAFSQLEAFSDETRALLQEETLIRASAHEAFVTTVNTWIASFEAGPGGGENITAAIQVETDARIAADNGIVSSFATQLTTVQSTIGDNIASVQTNLQTQITEVDGVVTDIGARWTAVVDVNGLVGGFGIYNNGTVVDAGFNVDNFWVGKVGIGGAPGVYPFIVTNGQVYMKSAMISQLTADQIDTRGLTIKDAAGNVIFGSGTGLDWDQINGTGKPEDYATVGAPVGTYVGGVPASEIGTAITNFNNANDRNTAVVAAPTIRIDGGAVDHTIQANGSADISFEWAWSGTPADIDGFLVYVYQSSSASAYTMGTAPALETVYTVPASKRAFILWGVVPTAYYTFGVRAYRKVDSDLGGIIQSAIIQPTRTTAPGEHPYRPSTTLAFAGDITGTISGTDAELVVAAITNFNNANDRDTSPVTAPTVATDGTAIDHTIQANGTADISFEWAWGGVEADIDGFLIYVYQAASGTGYTIGTTVAQELIYMVPANKRSMILWGVIPTMFYTFGVRAYRKVDAALGGIIQSAIVQPTRITAPKEHPYQPSTVLAFNGNITGSVGGTAASVIVTAVNDFNLQNNRNAAAVVAPTLAVNGSCIDHINRPDGSVDISFEWAWAGDEADIDGFLIYIRYALINTAYSFGTTPAEETVYMVPANKRAHVLWGVQANLWYTFGVRAYRKVDGDVAVGGLIQSAIVKSTYAGENPYQPATSIAFAGSITGTIGGDLATSVVRPGNPINGENVSTYISNLAVNTLQIGNNAVTVPALASGGSYTGSGITSFQLINAVTVSLDQAGYLYANGIAGMAYNPAGGTENRTTYLRLYINGGLEMEVGGNAIVATHSVAKGKYVSADTHSISLYWAGKDAYHGVSSSQLFVMGGKK